MIQQSTDLEGKAAGMAVATETREEREAREEREGFENRIARAFGHRYRVRIMELLNEGDSSPTDVAKRMNLDSSKLSYHFKVLADLDCIELVDLIPVKGTVKHIYRSKQQTLFANLAWAALSLDVRSEISRTVLNNALRRIGDALDAGTFDRKDDRHLSHETVSVDWHGWEEIGDLMAEMMDKVGEVEERSSVRSDEKDRFPATTVLLSFESPRMYEKRPV